MTGVVHEMRMYLGRYRLLGEIGRGGMAEVWLATSSGTVGVRKLLVVKRLKRGHEDEPELVTMFLDEARIAMRLAHPNVVQTYDVDIDDGLPFIAMEYLDGQPLHRVLRRFETGPGLPRDLRLWILTELLQGLHHAHELRDYQGHPLHVVHRDVNPQNVFITYHGEVKLMDFGIAKAMDSVARTDVGVFKGKLAYMAPEQTRGDAQVDRRVDVFAVGVMMWETLAGERMWEGRSDIEIATSLSKGWVPPLKESSEIPEPLRRICSDAIAVDPNLRWPDAKSMCEALRAWLDAHGEVGSAADFGALVSERFAEERQRRQRLVRRHASAHGVDASVPSWDVPVAASEDQTRPVTPPLPTQRQEVAHARSRTIRPWLVGAAVLVVGALGLGAYLRARAVEEVDPQRSVADVSASAEPATALAAEPRTCTTSGPPVELTGEIETDATLSCDRRYLLRYTAWVPAGVTLTIEPGTTILGDPATKGMLVVQPGGRLVAEGRADAPIVLTSAKPPAQRRPGDWGGLLVLGRAPINLRDHEGRPILGRVEGLTDGGLYGGNEPDDDSGALSYLRIEYSGVELAPNNEVNGLTLAGVGRGTRLHHVQVRHAADDCFELFGGTVSGSHLLCDDPGDDGFDWDLGYRGTLRFLVVRMAERGQHGLEGDNDPQGDVAEPRSQPLIANATLCGQGSNGEHQRFAMLLRRGTHARVERTVMLGFGAAVEVRDPHTSYEVVDSLLSEPLADQGRGVHVAHQSGIEEQLLQQTWGNSTQTPPQLRCQLEGIESLLPARALPSSQPSDLEGAQYRGAFRDREDRWDAGWAVWTNLPNER